MNDLYIVVELQKNGENLSHLISEFTTQAQAYYGFYYAAAFAAVSDLDQHTVILLNKDGAIIDKIAFSHEEKIDEETILPPAISPKYLVIEYQVNGEAISKIPTVLNSLSEALQNFHAVSSFAAVSTVEKHFVMLLSEDGNMLKYEIFLHE